MHNTDYTHTNNPRSIYLAEMAVPFPQWVKGCPIPTADGLVKLASVAFADRGRRLLPVHEKEAAFFSAVDYFANVDKYPEATFAYIKEACDHFGIGADVAPYADHFSGVFEKRASDAAPAPAAGRFAISTHLNGNDFKLLPLNDAYEITKSAKDLVKMVDENRIHYLMFVDAAREIVKAAAEACVTHELPGLVSHVGTPRFEDLDKAWNMIESRRPLVGKFDGAFEGYTSAVKEASAGKITPEQCMQKIAAIDDAIGLRYNYNPRTRVPLPHDIVFGGPSLPEVEKAAAANVMVRGVPIPFRVVRAIDGLTAHYKLTKSAAEELLELRVAPGAAPLSLAVEKWASDDQKELLRLAVAVTDEAVEKAAGTLAGAGQAVANGAKSLYDGASNAVSGAAGAVSNLFKPVDMPPGGLAGAVSTLMAPPARANLDLRMADAERLKITPEQVDILRNTPSSAEAATLAGFRATAAPMAAPAPAQPVGPSTPVK